MKGLIYKDLVSIQSVIKTYLVVFVALIALSIFMPSVGGFASVFFIVMMSMQQLNNFTYDDTAKWDRYVATMPVKRGRAVTSRYSAALIVLAILLPISFIAGIPSLLRGEDGALVTLLASILVAVCIYIFMISIAFPACYKFGPEKGRYIIAGTFLAFFAIFMLALRNTDLSIITEQSVYLLAAIALGACLFVFVVSIFLSKHIYAKKEY